MNELRYAARTLVRRPGVSILAVLTLGLGIGATVAVFTVVDTLLLRELPYRDPERVVTVWQTSLDRTDEREGASPGAFLDWRERSTAFSSFAAAEPMSFDYLGGSEPETLIGALVTEGFSTRSGSSHFSVERFDRRSTQPVVLM